MKPVLPLCLLLLVSACASGEVRETLGLNRRAPDEFRVVARPPLTVPREFYLRPPTPGESPAETAVQAQARDTVLRANTLGADSARSEGDAVFLSKLGAERIDPDIRAKLFEDERARITAPKENQTLIESWLGDEEGGVTIDAKAEAERIRTNKDEGRPLNEGEVKTVDPKSQSVLDRLLN